MTEWDLFQEYEWFEIPKSTLIHHSKQTKEENPHDHFSRCWKVVDKIQHPFLIFKTVSRLGREGSFFNLIKGINEKQLTSYLTV